MFSEEGKKWVKLLEPRGMQTHVRDETWKYTIASPRWSERYRAYVVDIKWPTVFRKTFSSKEEAEDFYRFMSQEEHKGNPPKTKELKKSFSTLERLRASYAKHKVNYL